MKFVLMVIITMTSRSVQVQTAGEFDDLAACEAAGKATVKHIPTVFDSCTSMCGGDFVEYVKTFCAAKSHEPTVHGKESDAPIWHGHLEELFEGKPDKR